MNGTLVIACAFDGVTVTGAYDGLDWAREAYPPGTRVHAPRKHWGSQARTATGTYTAGGPGRTSPSRSTTG